MGIYYEDKVLTPKSNGNTLEKMLFKGYKEIEDVFNANGQSIMLEREGEPVWDMNHVSTRPIPPFALPMEISIYTEEWGAVNVRYSKYSPSRNGKIVTYPTNRLLVGKTLLIKKEEKDLAWFLLLATKFVERDDINKETGIFKIYNPTTELKSKAEEVKRIASLDKYLSSSDSPIYTKELLIVIADRLGVEIDDSDLMLSAYQIRESVLAGDRANNPGLNIKAFEAIVEEVAPKEVYTPLVDVNNVVVPEEGYSAEQLSVMTQLERNALSKHLGTSYPPSCKKTVQIAEILLALEGESKDVDTDDT